MDLTLVVSETPYPLMQTLLLINRSTKKNSETSKLWHAKHCIIRYFFYFFYFYSILFIAIVYFYIQSLFISIVYILFYSIFDHYYSRTSIYIPIFSFVFYITVFVLYDRDLYSIFSDLCLIFVHFYSIFLTYILSFHNPC